MFSNQNIVKRIILQNMFYEDQYFIENLENHVWSVSRTYLLEQYIWQY